MNNKELNSILKERARSLGLCDQWFGEWKSDESQDELVEKYKKGLDFSIKRDYPGNDFIKKYFDSNILHRHNVYVDERVPVKGESGVWVINGQCNGVIVFDEWSAATLYIRHNSKLKVVCAGHSKVFISVFDQSEVEVYSMENSCVYVYKNGERCKCVTSEGVRVREKK